MPQTPYLSLLVELNIADNSAFWIMYLNADLTTPPPFKGPFILKCINIILIPVQFRIFSSLISATLSFKGSISDSWGVLSNR